MSISKEPLSVSDPNSFSNPEEVSVEHIKFRWNVDFTTKTVSGSATYLLEAHRREAKRIILDIRNINIKGVYGVSEGWELDYFVGRPVGTFGQSLSIAIPKLNANHKASILIEYECSDKCDAVQWLNPEMTMSKKYPFMFSQCQAIYARSLFPCQDTPSAKFTYNSEVTTKKELQVLMGGVHAEDPELISGTHRRHRYELKIPIPAYLVAIVVGRFESRKIGPRSRVFAERGLIDQAANEFSDAEKMLQVAEKLFGEYAWGIYDILVLPPSFSFGGMENPCLTFATPTLLAGDKSLTYTLVHEIAHSWFGNLVTNSNYENYWLNEGFATYAERRILGEMMGEPFRQLLSIGGWNTLKDCIKSMRADNPLTALVPKLTGINPEEAFSAVPYEKGCTFVYYLEQKVGGPESFDPFLKHYLKVNRLKSIDTDTFKSQFIDYFTKAKKEDLIIDINWLGWLYTPGMPLSKPDYDTSLLDQCTELKNRWLEWASSKNSSIFTKSDISSFNPTQIIEFLAMLLDEVTDWDDTKVITMEAAYNFNAINNSEIKYRWLRLCVRCRWKLSVPLALKYCTDVGRMKHIRPLYRELYDFEAVRPSVIETFLANRPTMMHASVVAVARDLDLNVP